MGLAEVVHLFNYCRLDDEELAQRARGGDWKARDALLERYADFVRVKARSYYLTGADQEDLFQEGMIGLFKAIRDYRPERETSFRAFAELCITRQIITAIKAATRQKHFPLNKYVSLNNSLLFSDEDTKVMLDFVGARDALDPVEIVIGDEEAESFRKDFWRTLSGLETRVLRLYMEGRSYQEIAKDLDREVKSIDNALQRIKRKVEQHRQYRELIACGTYKQGRVRYLAS